MAINQEIYLAADCIVLNPSNEVLLIKRKNPPFQGQWAFPGGFVETDEELENAAIRELKEETGVDAVVSSVKLVRTVGTVGRDPRFRTVSVVYFIRLQEHQSAKGGDDAAEAKWFTLNSLPSLAFDHGDLLNDVLRTENVRI